MVFCVWIHTYGFTNAHLSIGQALQYYFIVISQHYCHYFGEQKQICVPNNGVAKLLEMSMPAAGAILSLKSNTQEDIKQFITVKGDERNDDIDTDEASIFSYIRCCLFSTNYNVKCINRWKIHTIYNLWRSILCNPPTIMHALSYRYRLLWDCSRVDGLPVLDAYFHLHSANEPANTNAIDAIRWILSSVTTRKNSILIYDRLYVFKMHGPSNGFIGSQEENLQTLGNFQTFWSNTTRQTMMNKYSGVCAFIVFSWKVEFE